MCMKEKEARARKGKPLRQKSDIMALKCNGLVEFIHLNKFSSMLRLVLGRHAAYVAMSWVWR